MKHLHSRASIWILVAFVAVVGLTLYRFIPPYRLASGTITAAIIALVVLKHVGLLSAFGGPLFVFIRTHLLTRLRRRANE
jgi:hypothetical protein